MFCSHCGKEISSGDSFCKYCGNRIEYKNIGNSASETKSPKIKRSSKPIILGGILGLMICIFVVVFFVVNSQKNKSSNLNKTDSKLSSEEAIVTDVKTAGRLQSATQSALANTEVYEAVSQLDSRFDQDVLIMTINKNDEYIYPEGLDCLAEEIKHVVGNNISIKYTEKGADSFNIYITPQGGVCIYIGSKDEPRKWKVVPFEEADTLYRVNIEEENSNKEEASEIKRIDTIDDAKEADVKTAGILQSIAQATLADEKAYSEVANYYDNENKRDVLLITIIDNKQIYYSEDIRYYAEEFLSILPDDIQIYYKEKGAFSYSIYFTKEGGIKVYAGTKEKNDMWELVPNTDTLYSLKIDEYYEEGYEESNDLIQDDDVDVSDRINNETTSDVESQNALGNIKGMSYSDAANRKAYGELPVYVEQNDIYYPLDTCRYNVATDVAHNNPECHLVEREEDIEAKNDALFIQKKYNEHIQSVKPGDRILVFKKSDIETIVMEKIEPEKFHYISEGFFQFTDNGNQIRYGFPKYSSAFLWYNTEATGIFSFKDITNIDGVPISEFTNYKKWIYVESDSFGGYDTYKTYFFDYTYPTTVDLKYYDNFEEKHIMVEVEDIVFIANNEVTNISWSVADEGYKYFSIPDLEPGTYRLFVKTSDFHDFDKYLRFIVNVQ